MSQRLLNKYEEVTFDALARVCESNGARIFPKVRVADVFSLEGSGVSQAHFTYGLRSHFDFLVTDSDYQPKFSVEFDGPLHKSSVVQQRRDLLKNQLCEHFAHGLLRINSRYLTRSYRGLDLLTYLVDAWFLELAFEDAQRQGHVPYDEPFDMTYIMSRGDPKQSHWPYWLSLDIQIALQDLHTAGRIGQMAPSHHVGLDAHGNFRCLSWLVFDPRSVLFVKTGMRAQRFSPVCESDLVSMLAMFDLYPKIQKALAGSRSALVDRAVFFSQDLPAFKKSTQMVSTLSVGATV